MPHLLLVLLSLVLFLQPAFALFKLEPQIFDTSFFAAPESKNPLLETKVSLSFKEAQLSDVFLTLARAGDFDLLFPQKYDQKISLALSNQKIIDAIADICKLAHLKYEFKSNSLIITKNGVDEVVFESMPVLYSNPDLLVDSLNQILFKQLQSWINESAPKPFAVVDPSTNSIILSGNREQIAVAKQYIKGLDRYPKVKLFNPKILTYKDVKQLEKLTVSSKVNLEVKRLDDETIFIKGSEELVDSFYRFLTSKDVEPDPLKLKISILNKEDLSSNPNPETISSLNKEEYLEAIKLFDLIESQETLITKDQTINFYGLNLRARQSMIDRGLYTLQFPDQETQIFVKGDLVLYGLTEEVLAKYPELKALLKNQSFALISFEALSD